MSLGVLKTKRVTVTTAGSPVSAGTGIARNLILVSEAVATQAIFVQESPTASTVHARLGPGIQVTIPGEIDLSKIYFDASANNQVVSMFWT